MEAAHELRYRRQPDARAHREARRTGQAHRRTRRQRVPRRQHRDRTHRHRRGVFARQPGRYHGDVRRQATGRHALPRFPGARQHDHHRRTGVSRF